MCPRSPPLDTAVFSPLNSRGEGVILRGLVLLCPLILSRSCCVLSFGGGVKGVTLRSGTVVPPHFLSILLHTLVLTVEWRV